MRPVSRVRLVLAGMALGGLAATAHGADSQLAEQVRRGEPLYAQKCVICHQVTGLGVPPVFPPLAGSEWVTGDRKRLIKVLCEGLSGEISVKGQKYSNAMPAQVLDDQQVADVLTYVGNSWGNEVAAFTPDEVAQARRESRFKTYDELLRATAFQPLPNAPAGWQIREVVQLPEFCTRLAANGKGSTIYLLAQNGGVYSLDPAAGALVQILKPADYLPERGDLVALGMTQDSDDRLWIVTNRRVKRAGQLVANEVVIYRTSALLDGVPAKPVPWFRTEYPYGVGPYNHGVNHMAFGPDGMLYVNSGSRTDGGEPGTSDEYYKGGEVDNTACLWRLDPRSAEPKIEVFARGIRNAYGFAWDSAGRLFTVSNGPDAHAPEEMDFIEPGKHYGFPFQFADWPVQQGSPYPHTPVPPTGMQFTLPVLNLGPAGGGGNGKRIATFDPHSSPGGIIWCGEATPAPLTNSFVITRFGNLLSTPVDVGFDVLFAKLQPRDGRWEASVETLLAPLGRPLDVVQARNGSILILEYTRPTDFKSKLGWLPGRILELAPAPKRLQPSPSVNAAQSREEDRR